MLDLYGIKDGKEASFARNCLLARRLIERGVRFVQLFHEAWDQHGNLTKRRQEERRRHRPGQRRPGQRSEAARPARRHAGHLGRRIRPHADGRRAGNDGRDHHNRCFTMWLAGGGIKRGHTSTARPTNWASTSPTTRSTSTICNATLLHLLGLDHNALTYRFQGRDFRLTDVHGNVVKDLLA